MVPRRLLVRALLRASGTATALVVLYFTLPITGAVDRSTAVLLALGLLVFAAVVTWQVRSVLRSSYPGLRAIESLAAAIPLFLVLFAAIYVRIADLDGSAFNEPLSRTDALYYTITVFSTVGFGDIVPKAELARVVTMVQMLGDLLFVGLVLHLMVGAVKLGRQRRAVSAGFPDSSNQGDAGLPATPYVGEQDGSGP
ncbi:MAG TPA: potassium channel family protein [Actinomycetes bacterium]|nr:potassium channel family protein [Actinomycetes bacterium]